MVTSKKENYVDGKLHSITYYYKKGKPLTIYTLFGYKKQTLCDGTQNQSEELTSGIVRKRKTGNEQITRQEEE